MKKFTLLAAVLFLMAGCVPQPETEATELDEVAKQNVELAKNMVQAMENEDIDALKELYAEGAVSIGPRHDMVDTVGEEYWNSSAGWFEGSDSIKLDVISILPESVDEGDLAGDWILIWANVQWYDVKAEKTLIAMWHSPLRIEDGKIVYEVSYINQWDIFKQLGATIEWPDDKDEDDDVDDDDE